MQLASSTSIKSLPEKWVENILDRMFMTYGNKFTEMWGGVEGDKLIAHWSRELSGYAPEEIGRGLAALETFDLPPTLPKFKKLCRPGIDPANAYQEAVAGCQARERGEMGTWSHPAIYWAAAAMAYDLKHQAHSAIAKRWETALAAEMSKGEWSSIPEPMIALPAPGKSLASPELAAKQMQEIGAGGLLKPKTNHRAWIDAVLKRAEERDETLPGISVRFAKEALAARESN